MIRRSLIPVVITILVLFGAATLNAGKAHWSYSGAEGPENWGKLDPAFRLCSDGKNQSPVNLAGMVEGDLSPIAFDYKNGGGEILNNGHAIQVNYTPGSTINVNGHTFELKQFHFHSPSENTIEGKFFPMEAHFVHADKDGNLAVVALMFEEGEKNVELEKGWAAMPDKAGDKKSLSEVMSAAALLPADRDYYRFSGSLTTPPCSEGVWWLVLKNYQTASKEQIERFSHIMHHPNNRPVQPLNARMIVK